MKKAFVPIIIIAIGTGWLLTAKNIMPGVDWASVLTMAAIGILVLATGITSFTIVLGPTLLLTSTLVVLLQTHKIDVDLFLPILVISFGILMLISRYCRFPEKK